MLPGIPKTRWRKKSDFYTLFVKLARHSNELPLTAERREWTSSLLNSFAVAVHRVIAGSQGDAEVKDQRILDYVRHVERAASDLGARKERGRVLDDILNSVFPTAQTGDQRVLPLEF